MHSRKFPRVVLCISILAATAWAQDKAIHLTLPKHSKPTPVQKLNRDGVKAIERQDYEKARKLFYSAYLLDPDDPFTLNNLGYISELDGDLDRAARYYDLAKQQSSEASVDLSNSNLAEGQPVSKVAGKVAETGMQVNRINIAAINLLEKDRTSEADLLLQQGLALDPHNPFTLNNMGYAKEKQGELESALSYYNAAAMSQSHQRIVVTVNKEWRGKEITEIAAQNANKLSKTLAEQQTPAARAARLNLEGVSAMNRNDRANARNYFQQAYHLDPSNAFTLNNMGYLAELDGDRETADFYYEKARAAKDSNARVTAATRLDAQGKNAGQVAGMESAAVDQEMEHQRELRRQKGGPIELRPRPPAASAPAPPANEVPMTDSDHRPSVPTPAQPISPAETPPQN